MTSYMRHVRSFRKLLNSTNSSFYEITLSKEGLHTQVLPRCRATRILSRSHSPRSLLQSLSRHRVLDGINGRSGQHQGLVVCAVIPTRCKSSESLTPGYIPEQPAISDNAGEVPEGPGYIPEPPAIPDVVPDVLQLNALGEPSLQSMGLGSWSPSGCFQWALENVHVGLDIPWWASIVAATIVLRIMVFPLVILAQKNAANMHNHMPTMQRLQEKFSKSRRSGNPLDAARCGHDMMEFMKRNKLNPMKNMLVPMAQLPIFLSVFVGIRQMANLPVDSMVTGGLLWFHDLTVCDPFYALPVITMATFFVTIELGVDGVRAGSAGTNVKYFMRAMPFFMFPFIINFPTAMLCYWCTTNFISLGQVLFLRIPQVRTFFKIPELVQHDQSSQGPKRGFLEGFKESMKNAKLASQMEERQRMDSMKFKEAGMGPIRKTYPYDPTKVKKDAKS